MKQSKKKPLYPCVAEAEKERIVKHFTKPYEAEMPDFIGNAPNYEKYKGWSPEEVLAFLNID